MGTMPDQGTAAYSESCALVGIPHRGLRVAVLDILAAITESIAVAPNEDALVESADRLSARLAVVDLSLAEGDALAMLQRLHLRFPDLGVIILSLDSSPVLRRCLLDAGADDVIFTPNAAVELTPAARAILLRPRRMETHPT